MKNYAWTILVCASLSTIGLAAAHQADPVLFVGEDFYGNLVVREITTEADHPSAPCAAPAPCANGPHTRDGFGAISHGFILGAGMTGTATSALVAEGGNVRAFTCVFNNGGIQQCNGQGSFPALAEDFTQYCAFTVTTGGCRLLHF